MLDVLEVQDQLKNFSQEQLLREMQMPTGNVPQFLVLSELNRRRTMSQDLAKRQSADQPTVKEEVVASSGMPMENASMMAQQMAPKTSMTENTGIASMMPRELPSEEEPMKMSFGGLLMGSRMMGLSRAAAPLVSRITPRPGLDREVTDMEETYRPNRFPFPAMQGRFSSGLSNLGRDISGRVQNRTQEEVQDFIGEVDNMAQERFEVNLSEPSQRQRDMQSFLSGKGQPQPRMAMKDGGAIKAQNGMFADIGSAIASADGPTFSMPPAFASIYNFIKTNFPNLSDAEVRRQAQDVVEAQQNNEVPRIDAVLRPGLFKEYDMAKEQAELATSEKALREGLSSDANIPDISFSTQQAKKLNALKSSGDIKALKDEQLKRIAEASASQQPLSNFTGGAEMSDLVDSLDSSPTNDPKEILARQGLASDFKEPRKFVSTMLDPVGTSFKNTDFLKANQQASDPLIYNPEIYGESAELLAAQRAYKDPKMTVTPESYLDPSQAPTEFKKYLYSLGNIPTATMGMLEKGTKGTYDFFARPLVDGKPYDPSADLARYVGLPASMVDDFNKNISEELRKQDEPTAKSERDFRKEQEKMIYEESMKKSNLLAEEEEKEEEKKKKQKEKEDSILGGFGKASGALSDLSAQIADLKEKREKGRESEKWFALAEVGLGMLASQSPTLAGALGEGGLKGLKSFRQGKKDYDKDMLSYLSTQASIEKSQAELGVKGLVARKQIEQLKNKKTGTYGVKEIFDDIAKIDETLQKYSGAEYTIKSEDDLKEINRLRTRRLQLSNLLPAGLRPIEVDLATTASTS
tara:strand:- start:1215 stop:3635 length:2421 start_codon:yes stop_codon:yes gene_type:complete